MQEIRPWITLILGIILGALISIPVGYYVNLTTPGIQIWLEKRSLLEKGKSLNRLKQEYERVKRYHENQSLFYYQVIRGAALALLIFLTILALSMLWIAGAVIISGLGFDLYTLKFTLVPSVLNVSAHTFPDQSITAIIIGAMALPGIFAITLEVFAAFLIKSIIDYSNYYFDIMNFKDYEKDVTAKIADLEKGIVNSGRSDKSH